MQYNNFCINLHIYIRLVLISVISLYGNTIRVLFVSVEIKLARVVLKTYQRPEAVNQSISTTFT